MFRIVYFTGDIHGRELGVVRYSKKFGLTDSDTIVLLGDVAANYFHDERDLIMKSRLNSVEPTILCVHGNHENRPSNIPSYKTKIWNGGLVWYEEEYPNILFAKDGDIYTLEGLSYLVIGGAYSVDKHFRISRGFRWWEDEQPDDTIKEYVEKQISEKHFDVVLSHTCPSKYVPKEMYIPHIHQESVDNSTELWLDEIEDSIDYIAWFCGHWHVGKRIDKMHFLYQGYESAEQFFDGGNSSV